MAVSIPIISEFDAKGVQKAIKEFNSLETAGEKANFVLKKAAIGAAAAFAGLAAGITLATKAAMEDAQAQAQLAQQLKNSVGATNAQIAASEKYISTLSRATGVADDKLRPALAALVRGTKDIDAAQRSLNLVTDISIATNRDATEIANALAMAYQGNMRGLRSLSPEMAALIKEGASLDEVMRVLSATFGGAAAANAETAAGKMQIFRNSMNEATESLGAAFLPVLEAALPTIQRFADWAGKNTDTLVKLTYAIGSTTAAVIALNFAMNINPWVLAVTYTIAATIAMFKFSDALKNSESMVGRLIHKLRYLIAPLLAVIDAYNAIARITGLPQLTPDSISLPGVPSAGPTLGPPAAVTGGANIRVPQIGTIPSLAPSISGGSSGGSRGGSSRGGSSATGGSLDLANQPGPSLGQGMGIGTGWDLNAIPIFDTPEMQAINVTINSTIADASLPDKIVSALRDYNRTTGPVRIQVA